MCVFTLDSYIRVFIRSRWCSLAMLWHCCRRLSSCHSSYPAWWDCTSMSAPISGKRSSATMLPSGQRQCHC